MDIYAKVLLINWIVLLCVLCFDRWFLNGWIEVVDWAGAIAGFWLLLSLLGIPGYAIFFIVIN